MFCRWTIAEEGSANEAVRCVPSVHAASGGHEVVRLTRCYFGFVWLGGDGAEDDVALHHVPPSY